MIGLDSNVIVRYLAQDDAEQSQLATRLIEQQLTEREPGYVSLPALAEVVWVMVRAYRADRRMVQNALEVLLSVPQLRIQCAEQVWQAVHAYSRSKADFSDALIATLALDAGCSNTVTFDIVASREPGFGLLR